MTPRCMYRLQQVSPVLTASERLNDGRPATSQSVYVKPVWLWAYFHLRNHKSFYPLLIWGNIWTTRTRSILVLSLIYSWFKMQQPCLSFTPVHLTITFIILILILTNNVPISYYWTKSQLVWGLLADPKSRVVHVRGSDSQSSLSLCFSALWSTL